MALELVLARKAVVAAVLAPDHGAWELLLVRIGAMFVLVVASEVAKVLGYDLTVLLEARILSRLTVVASLVIIESLGVNRCGRKAKTVGETAPGSFVRDKGYDKPVKADFEAANTSATLLGARIIQQISSERLRRSSSG